MTDKEINSFRQRVETFIDSRRLRDAIFELKEMARRRMAWEVNDRLHKAEENYNLMLDYMARGIDDPDRAVIYDTIVSDLYTVLDALVNFMQRSENPSLYYSTLRTNLANPGRKRIPRLVEELERMAGDIGLFSLATSESGAAIARRAEMEAVQEDLFKRVWTAPVLDSEDNAALSAAISGNRLSTEMKAHIICAIWLGLMQQFDSRRFSLLMEAYDNDDASSSVALVSLLFGLWLYRARPLPRRLAAQLANLKEKPGWEKDLSTAFIEMIRARDTERINRKMRDELLPRMQRINPDIMKKINNGEFDPESPSGIQENPEWQEMMDKSGITDQLKELTEIQMEGGDVMMSTFAHLKQFPFFSSISNWFLPFSASNSQVQKAAGQLGIVSDLLESLPYLCDSDKYSFVFALGQVPEQQRNLMLSQLKSQQEGIMEMMSDANKPQSDRKRDINRHMQNIYRFFKLFRQKNEFDDPFNASVNLIAVPSLAEDFADTAMLEVVAEFYFRLNYYDEALEVFKRMEQIAPGDVQRYQKMGYAHEHLFEYDKAIEYYSRAELLDGESLWTMRRLAASYRAAGDKEKALELYRRLESKRPDDIRTALLLGYALTEAGRLKEAVKQFYKVEFMDESSTKAWRPLAWALFLSGDFTAASGYYEKISSDNPTANDYLNMGHVALGLNDLRGAINNYTLALETSGNDREWLMRSLADDSMAMRNAGIDTSVLPLVADAVMK